MSARAVARRIRWRPTADANEALNRMQQARTGRLMVTDGDRLVGILMLKDLLRFLDLRAELERD